MFLLLIKFIYLNFFLTATLLLKSTLYIIFMKKFCYTLRNIIIEAKARHSGSSFIYLNYIHKIINHILITKETFINTLFW